MQEFLESLRDRIADNPLVTLGQVIGMLVTGLVAIRYGWRGTKTVGRSVHRFLTIPPEPLAAAILEALEGETISDGESVLAGGAQVWPARCCTEKRVFVGNVCVDTSISTLDMSRIAVRAREVVAAEQRRRRELEIAGLVAKVRPSGNSFPLSGPYISSPEPVQQKKRA